MNNYNRWPIKFHNIIFPNRLNLFEYLCIKELHNFKVSMFKHSSWYYVRAHLEDHFNREFSFKEITEILEDKTWQWRTSTQATDEEKVENKDAL